MTKDGSLIHNIQILCQKFAKYHYDNYISDNKLSKIDDKDIEDNVNNVMTKEREKELKQYVRASLKKMYNDSYNSYAVENIFTEMFDDRSEMIKRISLEIRQYQK